MRGRYVTQRPKDRLSATGVLPLPGPQHLFDFLALQIFLRAAEIARNDGELLGLRIGRQVRLAAISQAYL